MTSHARRAIEIPGLPAPPGWSHAIAAGGWIFGAGAMATDYVSGVAPDARLDDAAPYLQEPLALQSEHVLRSIEASLYEGGADIRRNLIRLWQWIPARYPSDEDYVAGQNCWPCHNSGAPYAAKLKEIVGDPLRSSTGIGVRQLPLPEARISVDWLAFEPQAGLEKVGVAVPDDLPKPAIGYSPATRLGDWVFLAGFGATDFQGDWMSSKHMGEPSMIAPDARVNPYIWLGSEIIAQTEYTLKAMARIAEAAGSNLGKCVKADVALAHPEDFPAFEQVWRRYFPHNPPARNVVTGAQLVIKGLRVEIALLLLADDSLLNNTSITPADSSGGIGHAPLAMRAGDFVFTSGLLPVDQGGRVPAKLRLNAAMPYFANCAADQSRFVLEQIDAICREAGTGLENVCKVQAFFDDLHYMPAFLDVWRDVFPVVPPALSAVAMGGPAPLIAPGARVQLDAIIYAPRDGERSDAA
ncbi:MAG: RidA family protein [Amphiplicatus sp.]